MFENDDDFDLDAVLSIEKEVLEASFSSSVKDKSQGTPAAQSTQISYPVKRQSTDSEPLTDLPKRSSQDCLQLLQSLQSSASKDSPVTQNNDQQFKKPTVLIPSVTSPKRPCTWKTGNAANTSVTGMRTILGAVQRKFPGPAGLLPQRHGSVLFTNDSENHETESSSEVPLFSQSSQTLDVGPWQALQSDLKVANDLLTKYTVAWVKQRAEARRLAGQKVPFLAAVLHSVDSSLPDPHITLRDKTGTINGAIHRSVWESYGGQLVQGSALVLRQVGVVSTSSVTQRHYVNVSAKNVVTIYSPTAEADIKVTEVQALDLKEIRNLIDEWEAKCKAEAASTAAASAQPPSLFSSALPRSPLQQNSPHPIGTTGGFSVPTTSTKPVAKKPMPVPTNNLTPQRPPGSAEMQSRFQRNTPNNVQQKSTVNSNCTTSSPSSFVSKAPSSITKGVLPAPSVSLQRKDLSNSLFVPKVPSAITKGLLPSSVSLQRTDLGKSLMTSTQTSNSENIDLEVSSMLEDIDTDQLFDDF